MTQFYKPETHLFDYHELAADSIKQALSDASISFDQVQQAYCGYVYGDSTSGQRAVYSVGQTGIPIFNVTNNGCTGSSAVYLAHQAVRAGATDCALALGFEKMFPAGLRYQYFVDRTSPLHHF